MPTIDVDRALQLIDEGVIGAGMIPKVECCVDALRGGVRKTHVIDGRVKHAVLLEIFTKRGRRHRGRAHDRDGPQARRDGDGAPESRGADFLACSPPNRMTTTKEIIELSDRICSASMRGRRSRSCAAGDAGCGMATARSTSTSSPAPCGALGHAHPASPRRSPSRRRRCCTSPTSTTASRRRGWRSGSCERSFADRAFFCNSGAEANEAAIKLARKYGARARRGALRDRHRDCSSFHGRTLATITATGQEKYARGFQPLPEGFRYVPYDDIAGPARPPSATRTMRRHARAGAGRGRRRRARAGLPARRARALRSSAGCCSSSTRCRRAWGALGRSFGYEHCGVTPDVMTLARGWATASPSAPCWPRRGSPRPSSSARHGSTFGGNPLACAAASR